MSLPSAGTWASRRRFSARWKTISIAIFEFLTSDDVLEATTIGSIAIMITLLLVFTASKLIGKNMADMFR